MRQTAYLLDEFGYESVCYADVALALNSRNAGQCDFLIVDHDSLESLAQIEYLKRRRDRDHLQVYLLQRDTGEIDIELAVESADRGRGDRLSSVPPPSEPYVRFSRIRLSGQ